MVDKTLLFGRHNNGHFKETYPDSVPVIRDYDDVYSFLVEDPESFKIKDAIALHLFGMALGKMVKDEETRIGHKLTNDQITDIIDYRIGAQPGQLLDNVLKDARKRTIDHENISNGKINKQNVFKFNVKITKDCARWFDFGIFYVGMCLTNTFRDQNIGCVYAARPMAGNLGVFPS